MGVFNNYTEYFDESIGKIADISESLVLKSSDYKKIHANLPLNKRKVIYKSLFVKICQQNQKKITKVLWSLKITIF